MWVWNTIEVSALLFAKTDSKEFVWNNLLNILRVANFFDARANSFLVMRISFGMQGGVESLSLSLSLSLSIFDSVMVLDIRLIFPAFWFFLIFIHYILGSLRRKSCLFPSALMIERGRKKLSRNQIAMIALETRRFWLTKERPVSRPGEILKLIFDSIIRHKFYFKFCDGYSTPHFPHSITPTNPHHSSILCAELINDDKLFLPRTSSRFSPSKTSVIFPRNSLNNFRSPYSKNS